MSEFGVGVTVTIGLLVMVFLGVRVYAAAAMAGLVGMVWLIGWDAGAGITGTIPHSKSVNYVLSVLPMFILIGFIAYHAGLTHALFNAAAGCRAGWQSPACSRRRVLPRCPVPVPQPQPCSVASLSLTCWITSTAPS